MNYEKFNYYSTSFEYCLIFHPLVQFLLILHLQRQGGCMLQKKDHWMRSLKMQDLVCGGSDGKSVCLQCRRPRFNPWVRKIPWRRIWQPSPVFLPGKFHGWRSLVGYSPWGCKERLSDFTFSFHFQVTSVMSNSFRPHRLQPARLLCPWDSAGKNTGMGCHSSKSCHLAVTQWL